MLIDFLVKIFILEINNKYYFGHGHSINLGQRSHNNKSRRFVDSMASGHIFLLVTDVFDSYSELKQIILKQNINFKNEEFNSI